MLHKTEHIVSKAKQEWLFSLNAKSVMRGADSMISTCYQGCWSLERNPPPCIGKLKLLHGKVCCPHHRWSCLACVQQYLEHRSSSRISSSKSSTGESCVHVGRRNSEKQRLYHCFSNLRYGMVGKLKKEGGDLLHHKSARLFWWQVLAEHPTWTQTQGIWDTEEISSRLRLLPNHLRPSNSTGKPEF